MNLEDWMGTLKEMHDRHGAIWSAEKKMILCSTVSVPESAEELLQLKKAQLPERIILTGQKQSVNFDRALIKAGVISLTPIITGRFPEIGSELIDIVFTDFFYRVSRGETFGDTNRIDASHRDMFEQHSDTHGPFVAMSYTFLTFAAEVGDLFPEHYDVVVSQILKSVETQIRGIFFPSEGPFKMPLRTRLGIQEDILRRYAPTFDRAGFLKNNPVLNKLKAEGPHWICCVYCFFFFTLIWFLPREALWGKILFYVSLGLAVLSLYGVIRSLTIWIFSKWGMSKV